MYVPFLKDFDKSHKLLHSKLICLRHYISIITLISVFQIFTVQHEDEEHHKSTSDLLGCLRHRSLTNAPHPILSQRGSVQGMRRWYELRTQISVLQGVSVTQSGVVLSTVFIATLIFTPIFGKEFVNNLL